MLSNLLPADLRFQGKPIRVKTTKEPADIAWENLVLPREKWLVFLRRVLTVVVTLLVLLISFALIFKAYYESKAQSLRYPHCDCEGYTGVNPM